MQALKMFLNEEEPTTTTTNQNNTFLTNYGIDSSLLLPTNEPWQRRPVNTSWDFQNGNASSSILMNAVTDGSDKEGDKHDFRFIRHNTYDIKNTSIILLENSD